MIGMLSALFSAHARLRICFHPRQGISVGFSASMPGSSSGPGAPGGGRSGSPAGCWARAFAAAARRAAFSSTRSLMRSTALSCCLVPAMAVSPWILPCRDVGRGRRSVAGPGARQLLESARAGAVDGGLRGSEDGALDGRRDDDLLHRVLALQRTRGVVLVGDLLPDLLEDDPRQGARQDPADQADRPVGELRSLAQRFLLVRDIRDAARFLRTIISPTTTPPSARAPPITIGGLSR